MGDPKLDQLPKRTFSFHSAHFLVTTKQCAVVGSAWLPLFQKNIRRKAYKDSFETIFYISKQFECLCRLLICDPPSFFSLVAKLCERRTLFDKIYPHYRIEKLEDSTPYICTHQWVVAVLGTRTSFTSGSSCFTEWLRAFSRELLM